jgi:hypothetical protein
MCYHDSLTETSTTTAPAAGSDEESGLPDLPDNSKKLGWRAGVLIPCLLNIWGGIFFLRLGYVGLMSFYLIALVGIIPCNIKVISLELISHAG